MLHLSGTYHKVKIINPQKKSEVICRHFHGFSDKFNSVTAIRMKLIDELGDQVLEKLDFNVGYYEGKKTVKNLVCVH